MPTRLHCSHLLRKLVVPIVAGPLEVYPISQRISTAILPGRLMDESNLLDNLLRKSGNRKDSLVYGSGYPCKQLQITAYMTVFRSPAP